jgi:cell division protein FtsI/penicillin-binding protein 2
MEAITRREAILAAVGASLPDDSTVRLLEREFTRPDLSYLLLDVPSLRVIASRWPDRDRAVPLGSLVKPFVAFAHRGALPEIICRGEVDRCWKVGGHGRLQLPHAIAYSCNAYFLELARNVDPVALAQLGLPTPAVSWPETLIGLGEGWPIAPMTLVHAYCELLRRANRDILRGMRLSAKSGTAREIRCDAYAKTGTAPCHHQKRNAGDGYAIALYPAPAPRFALLVSLDGTPGSHAARVCGEMLRRIG